MPELITKGHAEIGGERYAIMHDDRLYTAVVKSTDKSYLSIDYYDTIQLEGINIIFQASRLSETASYYESLGSLYYTFELLSPNSVGFGKENSRRKDRSRGRNRYTVNAVRNKSWSSRWFCPSLFTHALYKQSNVIDDIDFTMAASSPRLIPWPSDTYQIYPTVSGLGGWDDTVLVGSRQESAWLYPCHLRNHFKYLRLNNPDAQLTIYLRVVLACERAGRFWFLPTISRVLSYEIQ